MNKKKYVTPECKVYYLQTQKMLTGSYSGDSINATIPAEGMDGGGTGGETPSQSSTEGIKWFGGY